MEYARSLHELLPPEKRPIFQQRFFEQKKSGWVGFIIAFFLGNFGAHMLYYRNGWGFAIYLLITLVLIFIFWWPFNLIVWIVAMIHGALGADTANKKIADSIYATLK